LQLENSSMNRLLVALSLCACLVNVIAEGISAEAPFQACGAALLLRIVNGGLCDISKCETISISRARRFSHSNSVQELCCDNACRPSEVRRLCCGMA
ncbi:hypothetical protein PMAYCL1PPCAC_05087, partial [Pristionchus mayeri]